MGASFTSLHFESDYRPSQAFRAGVSLHGHTLHSKEGLGFICRQVKRIAPARMALEYGEARYRAAFGSPLVLSRAWYTPPLSAHQAWMLESTRIEDHFGLDSFVSLSDHDDIEGPMSLRVLPALGCVPISVEWTVPYGGTFFHIGVHNLPAERARVTMTGMAEITSGKPGVSLSALLATLAASPETLIVFNHPYMDESGIGEEEHRRLVGKFSAAHHQYLHAFELNGILPWRENRNVFDLAKVFSKPLISGGDRHGKEPSAILNLTNAGSFSEFIQEIRSGFSDILITNQYLEPLAARILQSLEDVLGDQEDHVLGWRRWNDRAFYVCDDGIARSFKQIWGEEPGAIRWLSHGLDLLHKPRFKQAFRMAFARREEVAQ